MPTNVWKEGVRGHEIAKVRTLICDHPTHIPRDSLAIGVRETGHCEHNGADGTRAFRVCRPAQADRHRCGWPW
eukprot:2278292-Alexandrium_andersonii.AAC.1